MQIYKFSRPIPFPLSTRTTLPIPSTTDETFVEAITAARLTLPSRPSPVTASSNPHRPSPPPPAGEDFERHEAKEAVKVPLPPHPRAHSRVAAATASSRALARRRHTRILARALASLPPPPSAPLRTRHIALPAHNRLRRPLNPRPPRPPRLPTVTEAGYPVGADGRFDAASRLAAPDAAFGLLARGLEASRATAAGGITVLSCDNFTGSGDAARAAALGMARILDLGDVVACVAASSITFPNSMVDRITPATSGAVPSSVKDEFGIVDAWPVFAEPFCQWVLEEDFGGARLPLEDMNVTLALYPSALRMLGAPDRPATS